MGETTTHTNLKQLDQTGLMFLLEFHHSQLKNGLVNINIIQYSPELESELFNEEVINKDLQYHEDQYKLVVEELKRRVIP